MAAPLSSEVEETFLLRLRFSVLCGVVDGSINLLGRLVDLAEPARFVGCTYSIFILLDKLNFYLAFLTLGNGAPASRGTLVGGADALVSSLVLHLKHWQNDDLVEYEDAEEEDHETHQLDRSKLLNPFAIDREDHKVNPDEKVSKLLNGAASCRRTIGCHRRACGVIESSERDKGNGENYLSC